MTHSRSRAPVTILLIISLAATAWTRNLSDEVRLKTQNERSMLASGNISQAGLSSMNSFALALLLGGLRGPLVMMLWTSSENQKSDRDLEGFDTKVEWIRLLQPEFDSVHIFQIWNKAYNVSAQMPTFRAKYAAIIDALNYAQSNDDARPNDINTLAAMGQIYLDKLGNSTTSDQSFNKQVRLDSLYRPEVPGAATASRYHLPSLLTQDHLLKPEVLAPRLSKPSSFTADQKWNDGSQLQYLAPYQPFPYGVSTYALAYNYFKRTQILQRNYGQHHIQLSETVVGSRPAVALRLWSADEGIHARAIEAQLLHKVPFTEEQQQATHPFGPNILELGQQYALLTASVPAIPIIPVDASDEVAEALHSYDRGAKLAADAIAEYNDHMKIEGLQLNFSSFNSSIEELEANAIMYRADADYLRILSATDQASAASAAKDARNLYQQALIAQKRACMHYFVDGTVLVDAGTTRDEILNLTPAQVTRVYDRVVAILEDQPNRDVNISERVGYVYQINRCQARMIKLDERELAPSH